MNIYQTLSMAIKSILNNKVRSILTMLGIIIGVASVITLVAVMQGMQKQVMNEFNKMGTNRIDVGYSGTNPKLTEEIYKYSTSELSDLILGITPSSQYSQKVKFKSKTFDTNIYFGSEYFDIAQNLELKSGRSLTKADVDNRLRVCVIGETVRKTFFGAMDPVGQIIKIKGLEYTIIGTYEERFGGEIWSMDNMILVPSPMQREISHTKYSTQYLVKAKDAKSTAEYIEKITEFMKPKLRNEWDFYAYTNNEWQESTKQNTQMMTLIVAGVAGISLLVGGIGIMNIMLVSVTERTREIGIRMAIGARRRDIISQFLIEAAAVSSLGGILGILLGAGGASILGAYALGTLILPEPPLIMGAFLFSAVLGMIFGLYPANKASKLQPVDALRTQ